MNVLEPANVWDWVETRPVAPEPAIGILNVWVEPDETILNNVPEVPTAKSCYVTPMPFKILKPIALPDPVDVVQVTPFPDVFTVKTWPVEPMPYLVQLDPL